MRLIQRSSLRTRGTKVAYRMRARVCYPRLVSSVCGEGGLKEKGVNREVYKPSDLTCSSRSVEDQGVGVTAWNQN